MNEDLRIKATGYSIAEGPFVDQHKHRCYRLITPCGHEWVTPFTNFIKQTKNAEAKNLDRPCGTCGPKKRFTNALAKYVEKYGRDYDLNEYNDFMLKVRRMSDRVYEHHKQELNPDNHERGLSGLDGVYHLDHKTPIIECFKMGWTPEQASSKENLQMLPWKENLSKGAQVK